MSTRSGKKRAASSGKKSSVGIKALTKPANKNTTKRSTASVAPKKVKKETVAPAPKKRVLLTYVREDQPATKSSLDQFRALMTLYQRKGMDKDEAEARAREDMFGVSLAPFGRQKGILYQVNLDTGVIKYAASVFTAQLPTDRIRNRDLKAQAESRFKDRSIEFVTAEPLDDAEAVRALVVKATFVRGASSDSPTYKKFVRNEAHRKALQALAAAKKK